MEENYVFNLLTNIKSVEKQEDGELRIRGYASTKSTDRAEDIIPPEAWKKGVKNYKKNPIVLFNHDYSQPIGKSTSLDIDDEGLLVEATISKSAGTPYSLIEEGVLSTFSVGFQIKDADYDRDTGGLTIKEAELLEISVVSVPCNQDAIFSIAKSFENEEEYKTFKNTWANDPKSAVTAKKVAKASEKKTMEEDDIKNLLAEALAEKAAADKKAAEEKAAADAAEKAQEKKLTEMTVKVISDQAEKLEAELEKRFEDETTNLTEKMKGLEDQLAEKSEELLAMSKSKKNFGSNKEDGSWKKEFAQEIDNAFLLARITEKGYDTKYAKDVLQKVNTFSSVQVSSEDFEQEVSANIRRDIENELVLAPMFNEIAMNAATMILPIAPDTGYAEITTNVGPTGSAPHGSMDERGDTHGDNGGYDLTEVELKTHKMMAKSYLAQETEEDAILPLLPLLRDGMVRKHARGVENLILHGNHADGVYSGVTGLEGLLKLASTNTRDVTAAGTATPLTAAALLNLRKQMGKYGIRPSDVVYIVSQTGYFELLEDAEFQDANLVGAAATKLTGSVGQIYGSNVVLCDEFAAQGAGKYYAAAVNTRNFLMPRQRAFTVESEYVVESQHRVMVTSQRLGFKEIIPNAKSVIGLKYAAS